MVTRSLQTISIWWPSIWRRARDIAGCAGACSFLQDIQFIRDTYHSVASYMPDIGFYLGYVILPFDVFVKFYHQLMYPVFSHVPLHPPFIFFDVIFSLAVSVTFFDLLKRRQHKRNRHELELQLNMVAQRLPPEMRSSHFEDDGVTMKNVGIITALKAARDARAIAKGKKTLDSSPDLRSFVFRGATTFAVAKTSTQFTEHILDFARDITAVSIMFVVILTLLEIDIIYKVVSDFPLSRTW